MFGHRVNFNVRHGRSAYQTLFGSTISLLVVFLTFVYAATQFKVMILYEDTYFHEVKKPVSAYATEIFGANEGFNLILGVSSDGTMTSWEEDFSEYGAIFASMIEWDFSTGGFNRDFVWTPLQLGLCTDDDFSPEFKIDDSLE